MEAAEKISADLGAGSGRFGCRDEGWAPGPGL